MPFPYESYKQVFVENTYERVTSFASLAILSTHLLYGEEIIDQVYATRRALVRALALQWFGNFLGLQSWSVFVDRSIEIVSARPPPDCVVLFWLAGRTCG